MIRIKSEIGTRTETEKRGADPDHVTDASAEQDQDPEAVRDHDHAPGRVGENLAERSLHSTGTNLHQALNT